MFLLPRASYLLTVSTSFALFLHACLPHFNFCLASPQFCPHLNTRVRVYLTYMAAQTTSQKRSRAPSSSSSHSNSSSQAPDRSQDTQLCLQDAVEALRSGTSHSVRKIARDYRVPYATLWNRVHGIGSRRDAHEHEQLLDNAQQQVLVEWCEYHAHMGIPLTRVQVAQKASELAGRAPGKNWVDRFLKKHNHSLHSAKGHGLDPKRAKAFNPTTVADHFQQLQKSIDMFDIPPQNIYNWDEKGLQLGGGRKGLPCHYIFGRNQCDRYVARSDNLEIVSLLETVSADGYAMPPTFVIAKTAPPEWWTVEGVGG